MTCWHNVQYKACSSSCSGYLNKMKKWSVAPQHLYHYFTYGHIIPCQLLLKLSLLKGDTSIFSPSSLFGILWNHENQPAAWKLSGYFQIYFSKSSNQIYEVSSGYTIKLCLFSKSNKNSLYHLGQGCLWDTSDH